MTDDDQNILDAAREVLADLPPDERLAAWRRLMDGYCTECGRDLDGDPYCHCTNDE